MKRALSILVSLLVLPVATADEGRKAIAEATTITAPGSYIVTRDFTVDSGDAIVIASDAVTLDLNGMRVSSTDPAGSLVHVSPGGTALDKGIVIRNGALHGGGYGIFVDSWSVGRMRVEGVEITDTALDGILIYELDAFEILDCTLRSNGGAGIRRIFTSLPTSVASARVRGNVVQDSGDDGIDLFQLNDPIVENNRVINAGGEGIAVRGDGFVVRDNLVRGTQGVSVPPAISSGLIVQGQAGELRGNLVSEGAGVGVLLLNNTAYSLVVENSVTDNAEEGIDVSGDHVLVERNVIAANGGEGIYGRASSAPLVYRNNMLQGNGGGPVGGFPGAVNDGGGNICDGACP